MLMFGSFPSIRQFNKISQQLQSHLLAFLGVKLRCVHILVPDGGSEGFAIGCAGGDDGWISRLGKKTVNKIHVAAWQDAAK